MAIAKQTSTIIFVMTFSFLLGWYAQGYKIYSGIVGNMTESVQVHK